MRKRTKKTKYIPQKRTVAQKALFTFATLFAIRLFYEIPTPGINTEYFKALLQMNTSLSILNALSGSGLSHLSIMTLGISPYITASIIIQLLATIIPKMEEWQRGMKQDRDRLEKITIVLGGIMAVLQGSLMAIGFGKQGMLLNYKWYWVTLVTCIWTVTAVVMSLIGKYMSDHKEKYIGNGISMILLLNIIASFPADMKTIYNKFINGKELKNQCIAGIIIFAFVFLLFLFTVYLQSTEKQIRVNYCNKIGNQLGVIPLKLCPGGVVPIIFASSIMSIPVLVVSIMGKTDVEWVQYLNSANWFNPKHMQYSIGAILYTFMIFCFSYYYTQVTFNPIEIEDRITKNGGTIDGIRPGTDTIQYINDTVKKTIALGALGLSVIAFVPIILGGVFGLSNISFLGTSIIIVVSVILETKKEMLAFKNGEKYIRKTRCGGIFSADRKKCILS